MNAHDLTAVCERHGIRTKRPRTKWRVMIHQHGLELTPHLRFDAEADAVCHGLKVRYGITTVLYDEDVMCPWEAASTPPDGDERRHFGGSEFQAVVALADRLAGVRE
jgi:hypothetical protein